MKGFSKIAWALLALLGAFCLGTVALRRGETVNAIWIVVAAVSIYLVAYRYYALFIANKVMQLDPTRATPAVLHNDGLDFVPTNKHVLFGHHFAAIAGAGPLVGPVLAAQMGYLPGLLWLVFGVVLAGAVQDFMVLFISSRRDARSLGDLVREEMGQVPGTIALFGAFLIMIIILAVLAMVVVNALAESPWGMFTVVATMPIAIGMGVYMRYIRPGKIGEISVVGLILLLVAIWLGGKVAVDPTWGPAFTFSKVSITWMMVGYGFIASVLPVWLLLAPRDYLSTFLKIGTIVALAIGILLVRPDLKMPALTEYAHTGLGPVWTGGLFPFLFITIACGAVSGFHALISSGTTPKLLANERDMPYIGYGAMLMESFVAVMALVAASIIEPGVYFAMNAPPAAVGTEVVAVAAKVSEWGFSITPDVLTATARDIGETTILNRAGGAPTLAVGIAQILHQVLPSENSMGFWYHFAILFEALFILTAVDAGTARPVHAAGPAGQLHPGDEADRIVGGQHPGHRRLRGAVGLPAVHRRDRPVWRDQDPVAIVRHLQPDAGRDRADAGHGGAVQAQARSLCVGDHHPGTVAAAVHDQRRPDQGLRPQPGPGLSGAGAQVPAGHRRGHRHRTGHHHGPDAPDRGQCLRQYRPDGAVPVRGGRGAGLFDQDDPGCTPQSATQRQGNGLRQARTTSDGGRIMGTDLVPIGQYQAHRRLWRRLVQTARLCCGIPDYDNYVRHVLDKHPDRTPMDYKTFFRERQQARFGGGKGFRCC